MLLPLDFSAFTNIRTFTLNTGATIPAIGLGTWQSSEEEVYNAVLTAIKTGYRHIDTASAYGNEKAVGKAIADSGIPRSELFVTTKLAPIDAIHPEQAIDVSLKKLGLDYVDLYLMHWPVALNYENKSDPFIPLKPDGKRDILLDRSFSDTYVDMQPLVKKGKARAIGVSNFSIKNIKILLADPRVEITPAANQVELHPYLPQPKLLEFFKLQNILLEAYSPLGSTNSPLFQDKSLLALADKYGVSAANIMISWAIWRDTVVLPKSVTPSRIESNFKVVSLTDEDGKTIDAISNSLGSKRLISPNWDPIVVFNDDE